MSTSRPQRRCKRALEPVAEEVDEHHAGSSSYAPQAKKKARVSTRRRSVPQPSPPRERLSPGLSPGLAVQPLGRQISAELLAAEGQGCIARPAHHDSDVLSAAAAVPGIASPVAGFSLSCFSGRERVVAADPAAVNASFMLRAFARDGDSRFHLLHTLLNLNDMAALHATCRSWRTWLTEPSRLQHASRRTRTVSGHALLSLARCAWVRPLFIELHVNMRPSPKPAQPKPSAFAPVGTAAVVAAAADAGTRVQIGGATFEVTTINSPQLPQPAPKPISLAQAVDALAAFQRLSRLGLQLLPTDATRDDWRSCLTRLPNLRVLHLLVAKPKGQAGAGAIAVYAAMAQAYAAAVADPAGDAPDEPPVGAGGGGAAVVAAAVAPGAPPASQSAASALMLEISQLSRLETLTISNLNEPPSVLDFSALPSLPSLTQFCLTLAPHPSAPAGSASTSLFLCTPAQVQCLSRCDKLTVLRCGSWSQPWFLNPKQRNSARGRSIEAGLTTLIRGKLTALMKAHAEYTAARAAAPSSAVALPPLSALALQSLHLDGTLVSASLWRTLSQMRSLTSLTPLAWYADMSPHGWAALAGFKSLRSFALSQLAEEAYGPQRILAEHVLPSLMQCTLLQSLHLQSTDLSTVQLTELCTRLPHLRHLSLRTLRLGSVQPLALARNLKQLSLHFCTQDAPAPLASSMSIEVVDERKDQKDAAPAAASSVASSSSADSDATAPVALLPPCSLNFREKLPSLPSLRQLVLHERVRMTAAQVSGMNAALLARMPALKEAHFHQNLRTE